VEDELMSGHLTKAFLAATVLCTSVWFARAEEPIRVIMPFAAGSSTDALARVLANELGTTLKKTAIVENRVGAAGRLGVQAVKAAAPDGNTLLFTPVAPMSVYPHVYPALAYDPAADFEPVSQVATFDFALAVAKEIPARTLTELVGWLKANPSQANYGSPGAGTLPHFFGVALAREAGLDLRHVPFRGASAAVTDLVAGQITMVLANTGELVEMHKTGLARVLATSGPTRSAFLQDVPTFKEIGFSIEGTGWLGLFAPAGTPKDALDRLNAIVVAALGQSRIRDRVLAMGFEPSGTSRQELDAVRARDAAFWAPIVKSSAFVPEQ
jgi:tripartite-type tricarboxylate transporter receptor subunit TctC